MKAVFDRIFLPVHAKVGEEVYAKARILVIVYLCLIVLFTALLFFETTDKSAIVVLPLMDFLLLVLLFLIRIGKHEVTLPVAVIGLSILAASIIFQLEHFYPTEVYMLATIHIFIFFISSFVASHRTYLKITAIIGLTSITLHYFIRAIPKSSASFPVHVDDYIICTALLVLSLAIVNNIVSRRSRLMVELQNLKNLLSNIVNSMPSVLVGVDMDGKVIQWNHAAEQMTGVAFEKANGCLLRDVLPQLDEKMKYVFDSIRTREIRLETKVVLEYAGRERFSDVTVYPLAANGVEGAVIRIDDVTDKVRMEEMVVQSEKMLSVGGLAAGMAHEINNPLAGMIQMASVMADRLGSKIDMPANVKAAEAAGTTMEAIKAFMEARDIPGMIETIQESGRRVAEIVNNMLSFARKSDSAVSSHSLSELLEKTLELASADYDLKKHYDFKAIDVKREYEDNLPLVPCEGAKLQQVFLNILRNGAQAMQEAGTAKPRFVVRAHRDKSRQMIRIEIEDNGPGMDEEIRKRVFEPFFTTKPVGVGTGLGLSVSYFIIVENHGGEMAVESSPGKGSKFIIRLPIDS